MKNLKLTLLAVLLGLVGVLCGVAVAHFLLPNRELFCIGVFLVIAAYFMGRRYPSRWLILAFAVAIPYLVQLTTTVPALVEASHINNIPIPITYSLALISPALMALAGGWYGARVARRSGNDQG